VYACLVMMASMFKRTAESLSQGFDCRVTASETS
jgi:hypothetical protein